MLVQDSWGLPSAPMAGLNRHCESARIAASSSDAWPLELATRLLSTLPWVSIRNCRTETPVCSISSASSGYCGGAQVWFGSNPATERVTCGGCAGRGGGVTGRTCVTDTITGTDRGGGTWPLGQ